MSSGDRSRSRSPSESSSSGLGRGSCSPFDADPEDVEAYEQVMAVRWPASSTVPAPVPAPLTVDDDEETEDSPNRPMTKTERLNAKKKRRKERERAMRLAAAAAAGEAIETATAEKPVSFRLFSEVREVVLHSKEDYPLTSCPRATPLPDAVRARIARLAAEAALPPADIPSPAKKRRLGLRATPLGEVCDWEPLCPEQLVCDNLEVMKGKGKRKVTAFVAEEDKRGRKLGRKRRRESKAFPPARLWRPRVANGYGYGW